MKGRMRRSSTRLCAIAMGALLVAGGSACSSSKTGESRDPVQTTPPEVSTAPAGQVKAGIDVGSQHPVLGTPEETLRTILTAFIARDLDVVMAYSPPATRADPVRFARRREGTAYFMTDSKHVLRVVEIRLDRTVKEGEDNVAYLKARIETNRPFSLGGFLDLGDNVREYHWALRQYQGRGPWFQDGGGF